MVRKDGTATIAKNGLFLKILQTYYEAFWGLLGEPSAVSPGYERFVRRWPSRH